MKENRGIIPLRTILQNCLNHIENLESNRSICDNYEKEFQDLKQFSETLKIRKEFACTEGEKEVNRKKNRYKDILPFNVSRVILSQYAGIPGSDYINANFIKGASGSPAYIASQGPLPNTVNDFWRMVVECEVQVIVMACNAEEAGKHKCENYWVEKEGEEKRFGMVEICLVKASTVCPDFLVRTMRLKYTNDKSVTEERTICQFHYSAWPDHGVPPLVRPLLDMVRLVRDTQASETLPVLVHCSAGCGRTGTICAIDFVWGLLRAGKLTEEFSLFNLVKDMRKQRVAMVQTKEQYILVHQAVRELFKEQLRVIESHPYENIDVNGIPLIKDIEEPLYDTIGPYKNDCDEKQDENEVEKVELEKKEGLTINFNKLETAPPLPRKKRSSVPFSKHEKEVENFTEKNRCSNMEKEKECSDVSPSNSLLSKPRIAKLKALFERSPTNRERGISKHRGSPTVSRSHSLGAIRKPLFTEALDNSSEKSKASNTVQPIPDGGKLKVPKLSLSTTVTSKPVPLIKRSKSLKTISQPQKLSALSSVCTSDGVYENSNKSPKSNRSGLKESIPSNRSETVSKTMFKKSVTSQDLQKPQFPFEYKRRRSLESLIGDEPPAITWPSTVMWAPVVVNPSGSNIRTQNISNPSDIVTGSSKHSLKGVHGVKESTTESIKHQIQNLTIEAQKKMNTLVSGIGIRERRNSFRQAISRDDAQILKQNRAYEYVWLDPKKSKQKLESKTIQVQSYPKNCNENLTVRNQNGEILHPVRSCDQTDGITARKEEAQHGYGKNENKPDVNLHNKIETSGSHFTHIKPSLVQRAKSQVMKLNTELHHSRFPQRPYELVRTLSSHAIQDKKSAFSVLRSSDDSRIAESKNLFLQRLNTEIQEGKNLRKPVGKEENHGNPKLEPPPPLRRGILEKSGSSESVVKPATKFSEKGTSHDPVTNIKKKEVNVARLNGDERRESEAAWNYGRPFITTSDIAVKSAKVTSRSTANFLGVRTFCQSNESQKVYDPPKLFKETPVSSEVRKVISKKLAPSNNDAHGSISESSASRRIVEVPSKDSYADLDKKIHRHWMPSGSSVQSDEMEIKSSTVHHGDCYVKSIDSHSAMNSQVNQYTKKVPSSSNRKPQIIEVRKKNIFSGTNSVSSHSSGEMSHSDQHSQTSDSPRIMESHELEGIPKPEIIRLKSSQIRVTEKKIWIDDGNRHEHGSESSSSSSARELASVLPSKPSEEVYNYGIIASVKLRQNKGNHSRDDFVLGEPVAPPRVKRHASVKLPRQGASEPGITHLSAWTSPEKKALEASNWNDALGVDLDAVAASMQRQKAESTGTNESQSNKNYSAQAASQFSYKKQHYFKELRKYVDREARLGEPHLVRATTKKLREANEKDMDRNGSDLRVVKSSQKF